MTTTVERYRLFELNLDGPAVGNPYVDVSLSALFMRNDGSDAIRAHGFYRGDGHYSIRFMPPSEGIWTYETESDAPELVGVRGCVEVTAANVENHGPVRLAANLGDASNVPASTRPYAFSYDDGTRYLPFGTTCYAWTNQSDELQERTLATLEESPFNKVRMCIFPKHYGFNSTEPEMYPYEGNLEIGFDRSRFNEAFWVNLDRRIEQLDALGIEADIILLHPYDKPEWGFSTMTPTEDALYLAYVAKRYAGYKNVWWSLANEYDLMPQKTTDDWNRYARIVMAHDPFDHLRSIHNCHGWFDYGRSWITHVSWQRVDLYRTAECVTELREQYEKPVVVDECCYEGNANRCWGSLTAEEMTRRYWEGCLRGGYLTHGETYVDRGPFIWWAHGGRLYGDSPSRIAFCQALMESLPPDMAPMKDAARMLTGALTSDVTAMADGGGGGSNLMLAYLGMYRPAFRDFDLPEGQTYSIEVIDTWGMTRRRLEGVFKGTVRVELPSLPYQMVMFAAVER